MDAFGTNAAKPKRKPRGPGKPFTGADDPRRSNAGQRNAAVVRTAAEMRELYVRVLTEPIGAKPDPAMSNLEMIVRQHVAAAKRGEAGARETLTDRIWGKAVQALDANLKHEHSGEVKHEHQHNFDHDSFRDVFAEVAGITPADSAE